MGGHHKGGLIGRQGLLAVEGAIGIGKNSYGEFPQRGGRCVVWGPARGNREGKFVAGCSEEADLICVDQEVGDAIRGCERGLAGAKTETIGAIASSEHIGASKSIERVTVDGSLQ